MAGEDRDSGTLGRIAALLLSLALLAERAAGRSFPVRFLVLVVLRRAEAIARSFVAREIEAGGPCPELTCPDLNCPDMTWPELICLDEPLGRHFGAADAVVLALRLRILAAVLGALAGTDGDCDGRSHGSANWAPLPDDAPCLPVLLIVRLPARRPSRPP